MGQVAQSCSVPGDEIRPWLSNGILESARDGKGSAHTQSETKNAAIQLPEAVLEPISATQALDAGPARGHLGLVREDAIDDQRVYGDDCGGSEDDVDAQPRDGYALFYGKRVVEGVVVEREVLVEGRDLVDNSKEANEKSCIMSELRPWGRWSCDALQRMGILTQL